METRADRGAMISILAYIFLATVKIAISIAATSSALRADGLNNLTDIGASLAVYIGLKISRKPRDSDHPYGHSRAEQIASLIASFIMMSVGIQVIVEAGRSFFIERTTSPDMLAAWVAFFCAIFMYTIYMYNKKLAAKTKSKALEAAAKDNFSDAIVSIGTCIGIIASQFGFPILDPIAALIVGVVICKTAWDIFREASHMLTDGMDPEHMEQYSETIKTVAGVQEVIDVRARMYGNETYVDITITVDGQLDVLKSHLIADAIEEQLRVEHHILNTHIHIEPSEASLQLK